MLRQIQNMNYLCWTGHTYATEDLHGTCPYCSGEKREDLSSVGGHNLRGRGRFGRGRGRERGGFMGGGARGRGDRGRGDRGRGGRGGRRGRGFAPF